MRRKLFLALTTFFRRLLAGNLTQEDLDNALFYPAHKKAETLDLEHLNHELRFELHFPVIGTHNNRTARTAATTIDAEHAKLVAVLEKASAEGRLQWVRPDGKANYSELRSFLKRRGFLLPAGPRENYNFGEVKRWVEKAGLDIEVVC